MQQGGCKFQMHHQGDGRDSWSTIALVLLELHCTKTMEKSAEGSEPPPTLPPQLFQDWAYHSHSLQTPLGWRDEFERPDDSFFLQWKPDLHAPQHTDFTLHPTAFGSTDVFGDDLKQELELFKMFPQTTELDSSFASRGCERCKNPFPSHFYKFREVVEDYKSIKKSSLYHFCDLCVIKVFGEEAPSRLGRTRLQELHKGAPVFDPIVLPNYFLPTGKTCHQCKNSEKKRGLKTPKIMFKCLNYSCLAKYCDSCLRRHYSMSTSVISFEFDSQVFRLIDGDCPECQKTCKCPTCQRSRASDLLKEL